MHINKGTFPGTLIGYPIRVAYNNNTPPQATRFISLRRHLDDACVFSYSFFLFCRCQSCNSVHFSSAISLMICAFIAPSAWNCKPFIKFTPASIYKRTRGHANFPACRCNSVHFPSAVYLISQCVATRFIFRRRYVWFVCAMQSDYGGIVMNYLMCNIITTCIAAY